MRLTLKANFWLHSR